MPSRRHRLAWAVALFLCGLAGSRPVGARGILPPDCQDTTLPNGLRVVTIPWDSPGIIALSTVVFAGPRDETQPHLIALSNVASRLVETGGDRSRNEEMRRRFAVESSVTFEQDATVHSQTFPSAALQTILAEQARRLVTPEFTPARFRAAVDAEVSRLRRRLSVPAGRADWELRVLTSPTASLETPGVDIVESLEKLGDRPAEALETLDRWYRPERCVLVLAGQVEHAGALQLVERCFGSWKRGGVAVDTPPRSVSVGARAREIKLPGRFDAVLRVAYPIPGRELDDPEGPALAALAEAIFGATGPLYQALVVDEKSVAELSAEPKSSRERGWFTIRARIRNPSDVADVRSRIESAFVTASKEPIGRVRLATVIDRIRFRRLAELDEVDGVARLAVDSLVLTGRHDSWDRFFAALQAVTPEDIQRVSASYFDRTRQCVVTLVPETAP